MPAYPPAVVGMPLADVDTPALILDLDAFERNLNRLNDSLAGHAIKVRPHAKSHKCPADRAARRSRRGAVGVCCQKVSEAEAMVDGGVRDVLIANEVVGARQAEAPRRAGDTARDVAVCADDAGNVAALDAAARAAGVTLDVLVEVNVGAQPLRRRAGRAGGHARAERSPRCGEPALRRPAGVPGRRAAPAQGRQSGAPRSTRAVGRRAR